MVPEVIVYTNTACPYCTLVKDYLDEKGITYTEKNVSMDTDAREYLIANGHTGVPVTYIGGNMVLGFNKEKIDEYVNNSPLRV